VITINWGRRWLGCICNDVCSAVNEVVRLGYFRQWSSPK